MHNQKLKIGVLLDSFILPAWAYRSLERVVNLDCVIISLIIQNAAKDSFGYESDLYYRHNHNKVYDFASMLDKAIFGRGPDAFAATDTQNLFNSVPVWRTSPVQKGKTINFSVLDIDEIKRYQLDILIRFGFENLNGDILTAARFGVWSYYHGDPCEDRSNLPGFWEVVDRNLETGVILSVMDQDLKFGKNIYRSWIQTYPFSPVRNRNRCFWESASFLSRQIRLLSDLGEIRFYTEIEKYNLGSDHPKHLWHQSPSSFGFLWIFMKLLFRDIAEFFFRLTHMEHWWLKYSMTIEQLFSANNCQELVPPKDRFWADPQLIEFDDNYYIFVEEFIYKSKKGNIAVIQMERSGAHKDSFQVLTKNYHLSYPFIFAWKEKYYMIPETSENRTVELYECIKFPDEWQFKMNLMENIIAVDTTLFYYQEKWWLFTGMTENEGAYPEAELFLFYATELLTNKWTSHPLNPIVSDDKNARPAGRIFIENNKIFRPAQDCSKSYGWGININEILDLSETMYVEKTVAKYKPEDDKLVGYHTFSKAGSLIMTDACSHKRKFL